MNEDIVSEYLKVKDQLAMALSTYRKNMEARDQAEYDYRIAKSKKILELEADGKAKTLIIDIVRGDEIVSQLALKRDIANSVVEANREAINCKKIEINMLRELLSKEYSNG